jgi:lipopolysaccharide transport system ATP-binding protein
MNTAIVFDSISKVYQRASERRGLREEIGQIFRRGKQSSAQLSPVWALRDVSFSLWKGEILGVIGHNGAGKSTLLKLVAGITEPTAGRVGVSGSVASLLELGAGFHPDLSGRENIYLNAQLMGLSRRSIRSLIDEIIDFSELHSFIDEPIKHYSSGMYTRLAFAVAAHVNPDILLVDEVLSVGDASFQRRSIERMLNLVQGGRAVVFVSHDLLSIERMCTRVLWLDHGEIKSLGPASDIIQSYFESEQKRFVEGFEESAASDFPVSVEGVSFNGRGSHSPLELLPDSDLRVGFAYECVDGVGAVKFLLGVSGQQGMLFRANMLIDGQSAATHPGHNELTCTFRRIPLQPGAYQVWLEGWSADGVRLLLPWAEIGRFRVTHYSDDRTPNAPQSSVHLFSDCPIHVEYGWERTTELSGAGTHGSQNFRPDALANAS